MTAGTLWKKVGGIGRAVRDLGWLDGLLYGLARMLEGVSGGLVRIRKYHLVAQPVAAAPWLAPHRGRNVEIRRIEPRDSAISQFPRPERAAPYRFNQGAICLGAFRKEQVLGFLWLTLGPYQEDEVRCRFVPLPQGEAAWDFDVYVAPEERHGIVFMKLWDEANRFLAARQVRWSLSRISAFNSGSIHSHARMGARLIGSATFLQIGRWQIAASTITPHLHVSLHADSFPTYALAPGRGHAYHAC